jgi:hypothetical protein
LTKHIPTLKLLIVTKDMKILTLNLKRQYFDEILAGTKTHEYRDLFPENNDRFIRYRINGKEYKLNEIPSEEDEPGEITPVPIKYDAIKFLTGAYKGTRPYMIVEVLDAKINIPKDDDGNPIIVFDESTNTEFIMAQMDYTLGKVIEKFDR